jgi:hypothetical protein
MLPEERLVVARLSYQRALASARVRSSPASWRALLTASRNLSQARRDRERLGGRAGGRPAPSPRSAPSRRPAKVIALHLHADRVQTRAIWAALNREWARAEALIARSRVLQEAAKQARAPSRRES